MTLIFECEFRAGWAKRSYHHAHRAFRAIGSDVELVNTGTVQGFEEIPLHRTARSAGAISRQAAITATLSERALFVGELRGRRYWHMTFE